MSDWERFRRELSVVYDVILLDFVKVTWVWAVIWLFAYMFL